MVLTEEQRARIALNHEVALDKKRRKDEERRIQVEQGCQHKIIDAAPRGDEGEAPQERLCSNMEIDETLFKAFALRVCRSCRVANECYGLINKSEVMQTFCLPDSSVKHMRFLEKPNPHNSHWQPMKLYLRLHAEEYAMRRWETWEALEEEVERRKKEKWERTVVKTANEVVHFRSLDELGRDSAEASGGSTLIIGKEDGKSPSHKQKSHGDGDEEQQQGGEKSGAESPPEYEEGDPRRILAQLTKTKGKRRKASGTKTSKAAKARNRFLGLAKIIRGNADKKT